MRLRALFGLARPPGMVWVPSLAVFGWGFAHWERALPMTAPGGLLCVFAAWLCLHAGTMWWNAALDRDVGEVLLGRPIAVPVGIEREATAALVLGVGLAWLGGPIAGLCAAGCAMLAVLYSHPAFAWKGHALGGPLVNFVGYGLLSPIAGYSLVEREPGPRAGLSAVMIGAIALGAYFSAQVFQESEDRARGYGTVVATHGERGARTAARIAFAGGFGIAIGMAVAGWYPRTCAAVVFAWLALDRWLASAPAEPTRFAEGFVVRLLGCAAVLVGAAYVAHGWAIWTGGPVAGLATAGGHP